MGNFSSRNKIEPFVFDQKVKQHKRMHYNRKISCFDPHSVIPDQNRYEPKRTANLPWLKNYKHRSTCVNRT